MELTPTTRIVRGSHSHSSLSKRRPFQLHTSKSSNFLAVNTAGSVVHDNNSLSDTVTRTSPVPKRSIPKEMISLDTILKKKPSLVVRRMFSLDSDAYRAPQPDIENVAIEPESDDDATLVAGILPPLVKKLEHYKAFTTKEELPPRPVMLGKKIYHYLPDDEGDSTQSENSNHDDPETSDAINTPTPPSSPHPIKSWNSRSEILDDPHFEIVNEDDRIVHATALSPPPWHRLKESILVYEPAGPDDEVQCPWSGEPVRDFSW